MVLEKTGLVLQTTAWRDWDQARVRLLRELKHGEKDEA
jgi:hypothetical protein